MSAPIINDNGIDRPMTEAETAAYETAASQIASDYAHYENAKQELEQAKQSASKKLKALGLTDDEIAAIVRG